MPIRLKIRTCILSWSINACFHEMRKSFGNRIAACEHTSTTCSSDCCKIQNCALQDKSLEIRNKPYESGYYHLRLNTLRSQGFALASVNFAANLHVQFLQILVLSAPGFSPDIVQLDRLNTLCESLDISWEEHGSLHNFGDRIARNYMLRCSLAT